METRFKGLYQRLSLEKQKKENRCPVFTSPKTPEFRKFHVLVVQRWERDHFFFLRDHVQSCRFANLKLLLFCDVLKQLSMKMFGSVWTNHVLIHPSYENN